MEFNHKFKGSSTVSAHAGEVAMTFSPDLFREPTYFSGYLNKHIPFREAISALHDIVVSDMRFKPKDKTSYKEWARQQEDIWLAEYMKGSEEVEAKLQAVGSKLRDIRKQKLEVMGPFEKAKRRYFEHLYKNDRDAWFVYDPVITVHPDELFFECFSQDESSYGKLGCNYNIFTKVSDFKCGTTNIDYSHQLYNEFQKIRAYKETHFNIDASGFEVQTTHEEVYKEVKIDVPESWVRGFLQVSAAMTMPAASFDLLPTDIYNICFILKRNKEQEGPRSIRFILRNGQPVKMSFEPWGLELVCPRSIYSGADQEIRIWGRRRLLLLERLIPVARSFKVVLIGTGLPSFFIADLGDMNFTLGISGWTANDWSRAGNFDLLAPRESVDAMTMQKVFLGLKETWYGQPAVLAQKLQLEQRTVSGALSAFTQAGKVVYDIHNGTYRVRELSKDALPLDALRFANEREEAASILVSSNKVGGLHREVVDGKLLPIRAQVYNDGKTYFPEIVIDQDDWLIKGICQCNFYTQNKLMKGPCEHMLALRVKVKGIM